MRLVGVGGQHWLVKLQFAVQMMAIKRASEYVCVFDHFKLRVRRRMATYCNIGADIAPLVG